MQVKKKDKDLKVGDVITTEYGDYGNWVTGKILAIAIEPVKPGCVHPWMKLTVDLYGHPTDMYCVLDEDSTTLVEV